MHFLKHLIATMGIKCWIKYILVCCNKALVFLNNVACSVQHRNLDWDCNTSKLCCIHFSMHLLQYISDLLPKNPSRWLGHVKWKPV